GWEFLLRTGRQRALPIAGADETGPTERERVLPLPPDERRVHRVGGPEQLEDICLFNQSLELAGPFFASPQRYVLLDVLFAQGPPVLLELLDHPAVLAGVRGEDPAVRPGTLHLVRLSFHLGPAATVHGDAQVDLGEDNATKEHRQAPPGGLAVQFGRGPQAE